MTKDIQSANDVNRKPTLSEWMDFLDYDAQTGIFRWRRSSSDKCQIGAEAGHCGKRYRRIGLKGTQVVAHRLAWAFTYGNWPIMDLDHINGNGLDNRICNLRLATTQQNMRNRGATRTSRTGFKGVSFGRGLSFMAEIKVDHNKPYYLGTFKTAEEAAEAYRGAELLFFGPFSQRLAP